MLRRPWTVRAAAPFGWARWGALISFGIFAAGTLKVSRRVFWLTEERRAPRILGFFPLALLGAQFLSLFALRFAPHVPLDWMGLGCVLVAAPVLASTDAANRVFQRRTGDLVRPLPLAILLPLLVSGHLLRRDRSAA